MLIFIFLATISGTSTLQWTSSATFHNGTVIHVCAGENVTLPWSFNLTSSKSLSVVEWLKTSKDQREAIIAHFYNDRFILQDPTARELKFLPNAGLLIPKVTLADAGYYKVNVNLRGMSGIYSQSAVVQVSEPPATIDASLHAYILPNGDFQAASGQWHVQIGCGQFLSLGQPAVSVVWNMPSRKKVNSSSYHNNSFVLMLSNPVEEGEYSCSIGTTSPATKCLHSRSPLFRTATVRVHGIYTRLSLLEGDLEALRAEAIALSDPLNDLKSEVNVIQNRTKQMEAKVSQFCHATKECYFVDTKHENVSSVVNNIHKENIYLKTVVNSLQNNINNITQALGKDGATGKAAKRQNNQLANDVRDLRRANKNITDMVINLRNRIEEMASVNPQLQNQRRIPRSCVEVKERESESGIRTIYLNVFTMIDVFCEQTTDNGGWTVIQRRQDGSVNFYRNWEHYENGFGDLKGEFWIGLNNLYQLTKNQYCTLRIDFTDFNGSTAYAVYNRFYISGAADNYQLHIHGYSGTAGNSLAVHDKMHFTTYDRDNDKSDTSNCAQLWHGAWWYEDCHNSNLNGLYKSNGSVGNDGVVWYHCKNDMRSFKHVEMKIRV